jgi:hypothetical protein
MSGFKGKWLALLLLAGMSGPACAQRYLTGELSGIYPAGDYVVTGNIHVLPRTSLRFEPGSTLRFENFTGMIVRGELICNGTILRPIRFTSSRDNPSSKSMPEPFDWNGIKITAEAMNVSMAFCTISYSTYGLEIESKATPIIIEEVTFHTNGSASLTREREMVHVDEKVAATFRWMPVMEPGESGPLATEPPEKIQANDRPQKEKKQPSINWRRTCLYVSGGVGTAGVLLAAGAYGMAYYYDRRYWADGTESSEQEAMRTKRDDCLFISYIGIAAATIGAVGCTLTLIF